MGFDRFLQYRFWHRMQTENSVTDRIFTGGVRLNRSCYENGFGTRSTRFSQSESISTDDMETSLSVLISIIAVLTIVS
jgi:hypothetical protein